VTGTTAFLYVADSKLCAREVMDAIDQSGGRFLTVMPRSRLEDKEFRGRRSSLAHPPGSSRVTSPTARTPQAPGSVVRAPLALTQQRGLAGHLAVQHAAQAQARAAPPGAANARQQELDDLKARLEGPKPRLKTKAEIAAKAESILAEHQVQRFITLRSNATSGPSTARPRPAGPDPRPPTSASTSASGPSTTRRRGGADPHAR
jgi:hypothetical protein